MTATPRRVFINLPVADLGASVAFFTALGFGFDPRFTNENAACLILGDDAFVMLLTRPFFQGFTRKEIADAGRVTEVLLALSAPSRVEVDSLVEKALAAGGRAALDPEDHGFMYGWSFQDLDGHQWEVFWMDPAGPSRP